jgi:hypothetical protein
VVRSPPPDHRITGERFAHISLAVADMTTSPS